ncbi:MAG: C45 family autoproteolytic acyltransferase/hydrolase, partial [Planctomycetales bacterium]
VMEHRNRNGIAAWWIAWTCLAMFFATSQAASSAEANTAKTAETETIARCGKGWLERVNGVFVLHLAGSPYEMGYQHGALLKEHARANLAHILDEQMAKKTITIAGFQLGPQSILGAVIKTQDKHIPKWYSDELIGLADGAEVPLERARRANFVPELFHCSGFAVMNSATADGVLYHGRVLDYAVDWRLQEHAVIIVHRPDGAIPWVNVTFAGFIGCVTGMNAQQISLGEMGGGGLGHWDGVPMAVLMRWALREAKTLDEAVAVFRDNPRTCQYFYVAADGKTNRAVGFEASAGKFQQLGPGEKNSLLPRPVKDAVLLSAGDRYNCLVDRVQKSHGRIDQQRALKLMDRGVAMKSNLQNVLFAPKSTRFWVSYAGKDRTPAADRPYQAFQLTELLQREPDADAPRLPLPEQSARRVPSSPKQGE